MADGVVGAFLVLLMVQTSSSTIPEGGGFIVLAEPADLYHTANLSGTECYVSSKLVPHLEVDVLQPWMRYMRVISDIYFRFARTLVTTAIEGGASLEKCQEVSFNVVLPLNAYIVSFVMQRDGISYRAKLQERVTAERIYRGAIATGRTAAFVAFRDKNLVNVSMNIEPMKVIRFFLTYEVLLQRTDGKYRHVTTISSKQIIRNLLVRVHIKEPRPLRNVSTTPTIAEAKTTYTPVIRTANVSCASGRVRRWIYTPIKHLSRYRRCTENQLDPIFYSSPTEITIEFPPKTLHPHGAVGSREQFEVFYDVLRNGTGGEILVKDGHFVHFFGPDEKFLPKHVIFVLDISGSMVVKKLQQLKEAMMILLNFLRPVDYINIILFNDRVKTLNLEDDGNSDLISEDSEPSSSEETKLRWTEHDLTRVLPGTLVSPDSIKIAKTRLSYMQAGGATNTFGALRQAVLTAKKQQDFFQTERKNQRWKSLMICLTDGEATVGEIRHEYIVKEIADLNTAPRVPIYAVSFGKGDNMGFLTNLSLANSGFARLIREETNMKAQLEKLFDEIITEPLTSIKFKYTQKQVDVNSTSRLSFPKLLDNEELVVVGHLAERNKKEQIYAKVHAVSKDGHNRTYHITSLQYVEPKMHVRFHNDMMPSKTRPTSFIERAYAFLTIKQLIEQSKGSQSKSEPHPAQTAKRLAEEYSFITELTALVSSGLSTKTITHAKVDMQATQGETPLISYSVDTPNPRNTAGQEEGKLNWLLPSEDLSNHSLDYNGKMVCFLPPIVLPYLDIISLRPWIRYVHVNSDISFLYARTLVTAEIEGNEVLHKSEEVSFDIGVPQNAYVTGFVIEIDGTSYRALIKEKLNAEKTKRSAVVETGQTGAYLSFRESNLLKVRINIEPTKVVKFFVTYEELLQRTDGKYHHVVTVTSEEVVPKMRAKVHIHEPRTIKDLRVTPRMYDNKNINNCPGRSTDTSCKSVGRQKRSHKHKGAFHPKSKQNHRKDPMNGSVFYLSPNEVIIDFPPPDSTTYGGGGECLGGQLEISYDVERCLPGSEILIRDGFFLHSFAPEEKSLPKHIIFVLDVTSAMAAEKLQRLKHAVVTILNSLNREDFFNIILFKSKDEMFNTEVNVTRSNGLLMGTEATVENIQKAITLLNDLEINGDLKLYAALRQAVLTSKRQQSFLKERKNDRWKPAIMLLTHGEAFEGETLTPDFVIREISQLNAAPQTPIYSFSLAEDGYIDHLVNLSLANSGLARFIYEGPDASAQLTDVYKDVSNERLTNITFRYLPEQVDLTSTTKLNYKTYLHGGELVVAGRIGKKARPISAEVSSVSFDTNKIYITTSPAYEEPEFLTARFPEALIPPGSRSAPPFERMWAFLKIKQLIEQYKTSSDTASAQRALRFAMEYSFVTELTSMVVLNPGDENDIVPTVAPMAPVQPPVIESFETHVEVTTELPAPEPITEPNDNMYTTPVPLEATTINPLEKVNISHVTWLPEDALTTGMVELDVFGDKMRYFLCNVVGNNSSNLEECSAPGIPLGKCRHLTQCVMRVITDSVQSFIPYQCQRDNYLAVCCID